MLVGIAGFATSGKTSAANVLVEEFDFTKISFADPLKAAALALNPIVDMETIPYTYNNYGNTEIEVDLGVIRLSDIVNSFGWDHAKSFYPEVRRTLQRLGTEVGRSLFGKYFWVDQLAQTYPDLIECETRYVIDDVRFETESNFIQTKLGDLIWIERPGLRAGSHPSESGYPKQHADHIIDNDGDLAQLRSDVILTANIMGFHRG